MQSHPWHMNAEPLFQLLQLEALRQASWPFQERYLTKMRRTNSWEASWTSPDNPSLREKRSWLLEYVQQFDSLSVIFHVQNRESLELKRRLTVFENSNPPTSRSHASGEDANRQSLEYSVGRSLLKCICHETCVAAGSWSRHFGTIFASSRRREWEAF